MVVTDLHGATAQHKARTYERRKSNFCRFAACLIHVHGDAIRRLFQVQALQNLLELLAIFCSFDGIDRCSNDRDTRCCQAASQVQRCLSTELNDHPIRLNAIADVQYIFCRQRFKEQQITGVIVGTHRFRIRVDHNRLNAKLPQREARVAAAIVKFDTLTDTIRSTPENHDAFAIRLLGGRLIFVFVRRIEVRRIRLELSGTCIDGLEGSHDTS